MIKNRKSFLAVFITALLCCIQSVLADGTREMYAGVNDNMSRAGILAGEYKRTPSGMPFQNHATMKVYAKTGEHILIASSIFRRDQANLGTCRIVCYAPNGTSKVFTKEDTKGYTIGYIENRAAELGGPKLKDGATGGYTPFAIEVAEGQEGVWEINFEITPNKLKVTSINSFYRIV